MKKLLTLIAALCILASTMQAQSLNRFFNKYANDTRFESVSVGKFLLTLPLIFGDMNQSDREILSCINRIKVLTSNSGLDSEFSSAILNDLDKIIVQGNYDKMVEVREKGEKVYIYSRILENKNSDLLLVVKEKDEMNLIWINGRFSQRVIEKLQNQLANNSANLPIHLH